MRLAESGYLRSLLVESANHILDGASPGGRVITINGNELRAWVDVVSQRSKDFICAHPQVLKLPCDIRETQTVAQLLQHIVAVELRYAQRLAAIEETPYDAIPFDSAESIYHTHDLAMSVLSGVADRTESFWGEWIQFATRSAGTMEVPRHIVFVHLFMHSVRHYAQLATLVRHHGYPVDFAMDYIIMRPKNSGTRHRSGQDNLGVLNNV